MRPSFAASRAALSLAATLFAAGCGGAPTPATASDAADVVHATIPDGPLDYGFADTADAGFAKVTIRTQPCAPGLTGVAMRVVNTGKKPMPMHQVDGAGLAKQGDVLEAQRLPYDSPCGKDGYVRELAPGEAGTLWFAFDSRVAIAKVEIEEPDGLAKHVARFHLDVEHRDVEVPSAARPPAPAGALAVHETPYYRVAILDMKACRDGERAHVTYDVVFESFTNVPLHVVAGDVLDARGKQVRSEMIDLSLCARAFPNGHVGDEVAPRGRMRTWLSPFIVDAAAIDLALLVSVRGGGLGVEEVSMKPGAPRAWTKPAEDPYKKASDAMAAATKKLESLNDQKPAGKPQFRDLAPIPKDPLAYHEVKMKHLVVEHAIWHENHFLTVVPMTPALYAAGMYTQWSEKRYDEVTMRKLVGEFATKSQVELRMQMPVVHHGSVWMNSGDHDIKLPDDLAEYIFLEVDGERAIRCREAIVPLLGTLVGMMHPQTTVELVFDVPPGLTDRLMKGKGEMRVVVGGLGFKDKTVRYRLPLADVTKDAPVEITRLAP